MQFWARVEAQGLQSLGLSYGVRGELCAANSRGSSGAFSTFRETEVDEVLEAVLEYALGDGGGDIGIRGEVIGFVIKRGGAAVFELAIELEMYPGAGDEAL